MPTTPADRNGCMCRLPSPLRAAFPVAQAGRHPHRYFRGLLRLHSRYGPLARSAAQGDLCHRAPTHSVARTSCLSATRSNRLLSRWNLPPLATRAQTGHTVQNCVAKSSGVRNGASQFCARCPPCHAPLHTLHPFCDAVRLGPVDIHRSQIMAPTRNSMDANESAVFS